MRTMYKYWLDSDPRGRAHYVWLRDEQELRNHVFFKYNTRNFGYQVVE